MLLRLKTSELVGGIRPPPPPGPVSFKSPGEVELSENQLLTG